MEKQLPELPIENGDASVSSIPSFSGGSSGAESSRKAPFDAYHDLQATDAAPQSSLPLPDQSSSTSTDAPTSATERDPQIVDAEAHRSGRRRQPRAAPRTPRDHPDSHARQGEAIMMMQETSSDGNVWIDTGAQLHESPSISTSTASSLITGSATKKNRSSGALLSNLNKGLTRVGSVMKRSPSLMRSSPSMPSLRAEGNGAIPVSPTPKPRRQPSKLGMSKQGSIRRQMEHGSWRGRRVPDQSVVVEEDEDEENHAFIGDTGHVSERQAERRRENAAVHFEAGDRGIGRPFNVAHDFHVSPNLDNLPSEWIAQLQAQGLTEADLLLITSTVRKRQSVAMLDSRLPTQIMESDDSTQISHTASTDTSELPRDVPAAHAYTPVQYGTIQPSTTLISPTSSRRLPALTHLDDRHTSLELLRDSREPTISVDRSNPNAHQPPRSAATSTAGPSSDASPSSPQVAFATAKNKRLSEQLRGFAALNLDHVGSWADDLLGLVEGQATANKADEDDTLQPRRINPYRVGALDGRLAFEKSTSPLTPRSPGIKRAPVPSTPSTKDQPKTPIQAGKPASMTSTSPVALMSHSHSHSQSLSTAEDHELRTPSSSENDRIPTNHLTSVAEASEQDARPAWSVASRIECGGPDELPLAGQQPDISKKPFRFLPQAEIRPNDSITTCLESPPRTPPRRLQALDLQAVDAEYDLSVPSPLRPPSRPRVSLPASANGTDELSRPLSLSNPATASAFPSSPVSHVHQRQLSLSPSSDILDSYAGTESEDDEAQGRYSSFGLTPAPSGVRGKDDRGRKQSDGSIFMIPPDSNLPGLDRSENGILPNSSSDHTLGDPAIVLLTDEIALSPKQKDIVLHIPHTPSPPSPALLPTTPYDTGPDMSYWSGTDTLGEAYDGIAMHCDHEGAEAKAMTGKFDSDAETENDNDHLTPLSKQPHPSSPGSASAASAKQRNSARSVRTMDGQSGGGSTVHQFRGPVFGHDDRQSMALSTVSGESDTAYRDSMLGARVMTAQKERLGTHEMARTSVFSLSGYIEEEEPDKKAMSTTRGRVA